MIFDRWRSAGRASSKPGKGNYSEPQIRRELIERIFGNDPFADLNVDGCRLDLQGWNGQHPLLSRLVEEISPQVVIDVGVWKGQSTFFIADTIRRLGQNGCVIAVDTWLGSPEHWDRQSRPEDFDSLLIASGCPSIFYTFAANARLTGLDRLVVPLPQTSRNAAAILTRLGVLADLVHIDAAHDYDSVLEDCRTYWPLLRPGGVMVGDDVHWDTVKRAATDFTTLTGLPLEIDIPKWVVRKPA